VTRETTILAAIPVFDNAAELPRAIESLLAQTMLPDRILVVDDGSSEDIRAAIARFGSKVEYVRQDNAGPVTARNRAIGLCNETYLTMLDSDDEFHPERIETAITHMQANPAVGGTVCLAQNVSPDGLPSGQPVPAFTLGASVIRRATYDKVGLPDAQMQHGAALEWFLRARKAGVEIAIDEKPLLIRHLKRGSLSQRNIGQSHLEHLAVVRKWLADKRGE